MASWRNFGIGISDFGLDGLGAVLKIGGHLVVAGVVRSRDGHHGV